MTAPVYQQSAAGIIQATWDRIDQRNLPHDWLMWRVPVRGLADPGMSYRQPSSVPPDSRPSIVPTVAFRRVTCRAFDHGAMWGIVFGQFDGCEVVVETAKL
jgi:hypothetical protein